MENLSHSRQPNRKPSLKKPYNGTTNLFPTKTTTYDDVFGGPPRFGAAGPPTLAPRVEDYAEIFGGFHAPRASSIPVLNLPSFCDDDENEAFFDVKSSSGCDYGEVFGGFDGLDFAVAFHEELMKQSNGCCSSDEAWTLAETDSFSGESDQSGKNRYFPNGDSYESIDGSMEFNISYHKTSRVCDEDLSNGTTTHVAHLHTVPGYSYLVDETSPFEKMDGEYPTLQVIDDSDLSLEFSGEMMKGKGIKKTKSLLVNGTDRKLPKTYGRNSSLPTKTFVTVSDVSLKTRPCVVPPPSRPPPADASRLSSSSKSVYSDGKTCDNSPPYYDVEVDASSSALASTAAIQEAMEKAQAKMKSAKESFQKRKSGSTHVRKDSEGKMGKIANGSTNIKDEGLPTAFEREISKMKLKAVPEKNLSVAQTLDIDGVSEWKEATDFFDLVGADASLNSFEQTNVRRIFPEDAKIHPCAHKERKGFEQQQVNGTEVEAFREDHNLEEVERKMKAAKETHEWVRSNGRTEAEKEARRLKVEKKKVKMTQGVYEQDENVRESRMTWQTTEADEVVLENLVNLHQEENLFELQLPLKQEEKKKHREARGREEIENKARQALEMMENERRLKAAQEWADGERRLAEAVEKEEHEKTQREARKRKENERRLTEACEQEEKERKQREARERKEQERKLREARELEEKEKKLREAWEREENERRLQEALGQEEKENKLREEREENARRLQEALEQEEKKKKLSVAREREENEKRLQEALEREENEKKRTEEETLKQEENKKKQEASLKEEVERKLKEVREKEETLKMVREVHKNKKNGRIIDKAFEQENFIIWEEDRREENESLSRDTSLLEESEEMLDDSVWIEELKGLNQVHELQQEGVIGVQHDAAERAHAYTLGDNKATLSDFKHNEKHKNLEATGKNFAHAEKRILRTELNTNGGVKSSEAFQKVDLHVARKSEAAQCQDDSLNVFNEAGVGVRRRNNEKVKTAPQSFDVEMQGKKFVHESVERGKDKPLSTRVTKESDENGRKFEADGKGNAQKMAQQVNVSRNTGRKERNFNGKLTTKEEENERVRRERNIERERLRKIEEEIERDREREKDRMAVDKVILEVRDRAYADARERAEKAALERVTVEARQRAMNEARERLEKACAEARNPLYSGVEVESAQRCKARLERHKRTAERGAKALAEKNMRDLVAQREQAERNRLSETLDADVKRWSSGKEGNLRALLSTLQYILGPDSGWQPVPLTEVITSAAVKRAYRKATLCVHPDKLQQRGASIQQKYVCEKVFDLLKDAWNKFNSEER